MIQLFIDQDLDHDILRGLERRVPDLDAMTAYEAGLSASTDPELLEWAAEAGRIVVTHDRKTMPAHATDRIAAGKKMTGLIVISRQLPINQVIDDLEMVVTCSLAHEWENAIWYLPL